VSEALDTSSVGDDDERRGLHIDHATAQKLRVGVLDKQTNKGERQDVEERDAPEDLLDRRGQ
jgi:hypothetical protein